ncbi:MAG: protein-L-isoaspartate O-methyltransferase [Fervidobacterium sp.]|uniref:protein-L-isoaspartate O-methyltransferase n=1 Tax=Fervidobacterium sp. TaxID=1871331 RepID=UPI00404A2FB8
MYEHLEYYGVSKKVIEAMNIIDRRLFVPDEYKDVAYYDTPLPIGYGQTISAPHMVGIMCEYLCLKEGDSVLEIGTGSGYGAAVMSILVGKSGNVYTVEIVPELYKSALERLSQLGLKNVHVILGDGKIGLEDYAPYDKISVTCYAKKIPPVLLQQLRDSGILVIPVGNEFVQTLKRVKKDGKHLVEEDLLNVRFVPMV